MSPVLVWVAGSSVANSTSAPPWLESNYKDKNQDSEGTAGACLPCREVAIKMEWSSSAGTAMFPPQLSKFPQPMNPACQGPNLGPILSGVYS